MTPPEQTSSTTNTPENAECKSSAACAVLRGSLGFAVVSLAGFAVWAFAGKWFYANVGEAGLYAVTTVVFVGLSGLLLHPLVRGPNSLPRFYKAFVPAFVAYAAVWCVTWFALHLGLGEWLGSLGGTVVFAVLIGRALGSYRSLVLVCAVLFATHSIGYFLGGEFYAWTKKPSTIELLNGLNRNQIALMGRLGWGLFYGLGFGAGLGYAFFTLQKPLAEKLPEARQ